MHAYDCRLDVRRGAQRTASGANLNDNNYAMAFVDVDTSDTPPGGAPNNSSSADFTLPANGQVEFAGLYWGARSNDSRRTTVRFRVPGGTYETVKGTLHGALRTKEPRPTVEHSQAVISSCITARPRRS